MTETLPVVLNEWNLFNLKNIFKTVALLGIPEADLNFVILNGITPSSSFSGLLKNLKVRLFKVLFIENLYLPK